MHFLFPYLVFGDRELLTLENKLSHSTLSLTLFNWVIDWGFGWALQDYARAQGLANVHVTKLAFADDVMMQ